MLNKSTPSTVRISDKSYSFTETAKSVCAAFFGVQSERNRKKDFSQGKLSHFIIAGLIAVAIFIGALITIVSWVLP